MMRKMLNLLSIVAISGAVACGPKDGPVVAEPVNVEINATYEKGNFSKGDAIGVYTPAENIRFAASQANGTKAVFQGKLEDSAAAEYLLAIYPADVTSSTDPAKIAFDLSSQNPATPIDIAWSRVAKPGFGVPVEMEFNTLVGTINVELKNATDQTVKVSTFSLSSTSKAYYTTGTCNFSKSTARNNYSNESLQVTLNEADGVINPGATKVVPVKVFPGGSDTGQAELKILITDSKGKEYEVIRYVSFMRPSVGEEVKADFTIIEDMLDETAKNFVIVYPKGASEIVVNAASELKNAIYTLGGIEIPVVSDDASEAEYEILVGDVNRVSAKELIPEQYSYVVKYENKKMLLKGSGDEELIAAMYEFERTILNNGKYVADKKLKFTSEIDITKKYGEKMAMRHMIDGRFDFDLEDIFLKKFSGSGSMTVAQGACTDGTYFYGAFRTANETQCVVIKYRLSDYAKVAELELNLSDVGGLCHVNDMVYEASTGLIYVCGWANTIGTNLKTLLLVDAATMTQKASQPGLIHNPTAIAYNIPKKIFQSRSGTNVYVSGPGYSSTKIVNTSYQNYGYTNQGAGGDDMFVYYPVNNGTNSQLLVFSWDGEQLWNVQINNKIESESLFVVEDRYYWWCYCASAGYLYQLVPHIKYSFGFKGGWSEQPSPAASKY